MLRLIFIFILNDYGYELNFENKDINVCVERERERERRIVTRCQ